LDDLFNVISTVFLNPKYPLSNIRVASSFDHGALEYIDELNNKFPIPILWKL
jgi:hypothetical protein